MSQFFALKLRDVRSGHDDQLTIADPETFQDVFVVEWDCDLGLLVEVPQLRGESFLVQPRNLDGDLTDLPAGSGVATLTGHQQKRIKCGLFRLPDFSVNCIYVHIVYYIQSVTEIPRWIAINDI